MVYVGTDFGGCKTGSIDTGKGKGQQEAVEGFWSPAGFKAAGRAGLGLFGKEPAATAARGAEGVDPKGSVAAPKSVTEKKPPEEKKKTGDNAAEDVSAMFRDPQVGGNVYVMLS